MATSDMNMEDSLVHENGGEESKDLVGSPYAVIESDPGVFTSIMQKLGIIGLQAHEILTLDSLLPGFCPYGFILCFKWCEDSYRREDYHNDEADTQLPWFANQLSNDSCATLALLNIVFNCEVNFGPRLSSFKEFTDELSPAVRGLCIASSHELRQVHNSFARPADLRASLSKIADTTMHPPKKSAKPKGLTKAASKSKTIAAPAEPSPDQYHFLSYVPYEGRVWEMDGLKSAPLECAELEADEPWLEAVLPALRGRIEALSRAGDIRFNLLAIVPCAYQAKMVDFELGKREVTYIERRLQEHHGENWKEKVAENLYNLRNDAFSRTGLPSSRLGAGFGSRSNEIGVKILRMSPELLPAEWNRSVTRLVSLQLVVDDDLKDVKDVTTEHIKRTHDYEPFIREYVTRLYNAGFLQDLLDIDGSGRIRKPTQKNKR